MAVVMAPGVKVESRKRKVEYHTEEEIKRGMKESGSWLKKTVDYKEKPVLKETFSPGKLSEESLKCLLSSWNLIRYTAGLQPVELDEKYTKLLG